MSDSEFQYGLSHSRVPLVRSMMETFAGSKVQQTSSHININEISSLYLSTRMDEVTHSNAAMVVEKTNEHFRILGPTSATWQWQHRLTRMSHFDSVRECGKCLHFFFSTCHGSYFKLGALEINSWAIK